MLDLMALDSNAQYDRNGFRLPHFTSFPTPESAGVNVFNQDLSSDDGSIVNAYAFLPIALIGPLLRFIRSQRAVGTLVAPEPALFPLGGRWLMLWPKVEYLFAPKGCADAVLFPSKSGFKPKEVNYPIWAFRVGEH